MDREQEARLLELYYGLLSEQEAAEIQRRIASDAQWAEAWAKTQQMADRFAEAARWRTDRLELPQAERLESQESAGVPSVEEPAKPLLRSELVRSDRPSGSGKPSWKSVPPKRTDRWAVGVVYGGAVVLLLAAFWGAMVHRRYLLALTGDPLRLVVQGPSVLRSGTENHFLVLASRVDGEPVESQVELALFGPDQKRFFSQKETTDSQGQVRVVLPADMDLPRWVDLKVTAEAGGKRESSSARLAAAPVDYQTFLGLDRLYYRPGDRVLFRSLSAPRFRRAVEEEMWVEFEVRDAEDRPVPGSYQEGRTWQGVGCGEFRIPPDMPSGLYSVAVRNAQRRFAEVRKPFWVTPPLNERFQTTVEFQKPPYRPGQTVSVQIEVREKNKPASKQPVELWVDLAGVLLHRETLQTDDAGRLQTSFHLPDRLPGPDAWLWVKLSGCHPPVIQWRPIPLSTPRLECRFYPEGGLLAAGVENRVYFCVRDRQGRPVEVRGVLLDRQDRTAAEAHTSHLGRGVFQFVPQDEQKYRFRIVHPEEVSQETELPPVSAGGRVLVKTDRTVVGPGAPVEFRLVTPPGVKAPLPFVAAVMCRGVQAARQWAVVPTPQGGRPGETFVQIALPPDLWGLLQLRVYDYSRTPPVLAAERLLYRLPNRRLQAELTLLQSQPRPGHPVQVRLGVKDEQGGPLSAAAGLAVVEEKFLGTMPGLCPISPCWFLDGLWELPEDLEQADDLLSDRPESRKALDLLLGTWGGRPIDAVDRDDRSLGAFSFPPIGEQSISPSHSLEEAPPLLLDNLHRIQADYREAMEVFQKARPETLNAITLSSLLGGVALVLFVSMATLLQISGGVRIWAPSLVGASLCVGVGLVLAHPERLRPSSPYAVPFAEYPPSEGFAARESSPQAGRESAPSAGSLASGESSRSGEKTGFSADKAGSSSTGQGGATPLPVNLSLGMVQAFGVPRTTWRRLLSVGLQEAQQLGWEISAQEPKESSPPVSAQPVSPSQGKPPKPPESLVPSETSGAGFSAARPSGDQSSSPDKQAETADALVPPWESSEAFSPLPGSRFVVREYVHRADRSPAASRPEKIRPPVVLYWHPFFLTGPEGSAECRFEVPEQPGVFRIRADVQAAEGRMTLVEAKIPVRPPSASGGSESEKPPADKKPP